MSIVGNISITKGKILRLEGVINENPDLVKHLKQSKSLFLYYKK